MARARPNKAFLFTVVVFYAALMGASKKKCKDSLRKILLRNKAHKKTIIFHDGLKIFIKLTTVLLL